MNNETQIDFQVLAIFDGKFVEEFNETILKSFYKKVIVISAEIVSLQFNANVKL